MKTVEEWLGQYTNLTSQVVKDIQSDAFHAGKLAGLEEAKEIVAQHGGLKNPVLEWNPNLK